MTSPTRWRGATTRSRASASTRACCTSPAAPRSTCGSARPPRGLKLYVRRVFIMDDAEPFLPHYLRFIKGVVDSNDLPLNVSRELLQQDPEVDAIKRGLTKRVLDLLAKLAKDEPEKYATFWKEFGAVLKEGVAQDHANRDRILPLLRFASTHDEGNEPTTSLAEYVERMKPGQERIYYVIAESIAGGALEPVHREAQGARTGGAAAGRARRRVGDGPARQVRGQALQGRRPRGSGARRARERGRTRSSTTTEVKESRDLLKRVKEAVGERVEEVRASTRLKDSPAVLVLGEHDMGANMRRIFAAAGQKVPDIQTDARGERRAPDREVSGEHRGRAAVRRAREPDLRSGRACRGRAARQPGRVRPTSQPSAGEARGPARLGARATPS